MLTSTDIIRATKGKFFRVTFIKKDGSVRNMVARLGVKHNLVGGKNTVAHISKYITVYDVQKKEYRNVNTETIIEIKAFGQIFNFEQFNKQSANIKGDINDVQLQEQII